ncbi:MAG: PLP-dependent aminotransferase family protein [Lachnospiraceae bacterium]|nr:PLP-dependent aminotransferase family protein [Lachnospiraceae bacterium]
MLTYELDRDSGVPMYEALYRAIKEDIRRDVLKAGEKLPSKRAFAEHLGVSTITVENAYAQLISEGYVISKPKSGYFVADISSIRQLYAAPMKTDAVVGGIGGDGRAAVAGLGIDSRAANGPLLNLSSNQTAAERFPFSIWARLLREIISEKTEDLMTVSPGCGIRELREAIVHHLSEFRGMVVSPEQVVIGAGTEYLYSLIIQLLGRDKICCVENPGHAKIAEVYRSHGASVVHVPLDEKGLSVEALGQTRAEVVHISPTHHFPTGITMPADRRYELLAWARAEAGRYIIEDDYDSEFRLTGKPIPALAGMDPGSSVIYMNTFSKSLASTIRISYMVLPPALVPVFREKLGFYACTVSNFEQYTLAAFIRKGYFERHLNRMRLYYTRLRKAVLKTIRDSGVKDLCRVMESDSGLHLLLQLKTTLPNQVIEARLLERGIRLTALDKYYVAPAKAEGHTFILNYSDLDPEALGGALEVLGEILRGES